ncbi:MAG: FtsX-like permease family protein [Chloroflexi bacterium]|nr:FtsX-like permease family protein [Chloroflexota bacterium]
MNLSVMRPSWRKVVADLRADRSRTILVVASIAVGVFAIGAIVTTYSVIEEDIAVSYALSQPANIEIITGPFDDELVSAIERIPGVVGAEGRHVMSVRVSRDGEGWRSLSVYAADDFITSDVNLLTPLEGTIYPSDRELIVRYDRMNDTGLTPGDVALVELSDGSIRRLPVVGKVGDQSAAGDFASPPRGYVTLDTVEWLGGQETYNRLYVQVNDGDDESVIEAAAALVEDKLERTGRQIYRTNTNRTTEHPMASTVLAILGVLVALGVLVMLLSSSLIFNTLNALLAQHRRQIGVMKLVGGRSFQISLMYLALIIAYGLIALVIALPLGMVAGYGFALFMGGFMSIDIQPFRIVPLAIGLQIIVALAVPIAAGYFPVNRGVNTSVRQAISDHGPGESTSSSGWLDRLGIRFEWLSRPLLLTIRNTFRRKGRLALTLFTLVVAGAIFIGIFNVRSSLDGFMDTLGQHSLADVTVTFEQPYRVSRVEQAAYQIPGVEQVEGWSGANAEILDDEGELISNLIISAPPAGSALIEPELLAGRWMTPEDGKALVISDSIYSDYPDLMPGDTLTLEIQGERAEEWTVVGVFRFTDMFGDLLGYANYETISRLIGAPQQAASYRLVVDLDTLDRQDEIGRALDRSLRDQGFKVSNVEAGLVTRQQQSQGINILVIFLLSMAILTAIVGSIGLTGTMGMNVLERTREIGVMRAIGAVDREVIRSVVLEGMIIGLISWAAALALSFPISFLLLRIISTAMIDTVMTLVLTPLGMVIWLFAIVVLSVLASIVPARSAARLTIREVLAYE